MKERKEINKELTWDLSFIYKNQEQFEDELKNIPLMVEKIVEYKDKLATHGTLLLEFMQKNEELSQAIHRAYTYAHLIHDQDLTDNEKTSLQQRVLNVYAEMEAKCSFVQIELAEIDDEKWQKLVKEEPRLSLYNKHMDDILRRKKHLMSEIEESLLSTLSPVLETSENVFSVFNNSDFPFPKIELEDGKEAVLNHSLYNKLMESPRREIRKEAATKMMEGYKQFKNVLAQTLASKIQMHVIEAKLRKFSSARAAALFNNNIPESVYDQLIATTNENLHLLHRYLKIRKNILGYDKLEAYDLVSPLIKAEEKNYTIEEAKEILLKALAPLGEDYLAKLKQAFAERWIDFAVNKGKRSGAYSSGCYGTRPYILISWEGTLDNLYTLAHELGHSLHSALTWENQPYVYASYSIFLAEIASTTNENLLTHYLLNTAQTKEFKKTIINHYLQGVIGTVYRQVSFAEFEYEAHKIQEQGIPLTADIFTKLYSEISGKYNGEIVEKNDYSIYNWGRIPHFYYNFYVYQYATGFSAATAFFKDIIENGQEAVNRYLKFLSSGCHAYPIEVLKEAGLDMTSAKPVQAVFEKFKEYLDLFEKSMQDNND